MTDKLDIVGIGNAMVDAIIPSNKDEVEKNNLNRDSMNLIDEDLKNSLHNNYSIKEMAGGGSLGNSMFGITSFGGNGSFIGKIKNDEVGIFLQKDMVREGLQFPLGFTSPDISTGCCTIFVEEDGTRTMCTFLGAGTLIGPDDINAQHIKNMEADELLKRASEFISSESIFHKQSDEWKASFLALYQDKVQLFPELNDSIKDITSEKIIVSILSLKIFIISLFFLTFHFLL